MSFYFNQFESIKLVDVSGSNICKPMNFHIIEENIRTVKYQTTVEFMNDIRWLCHNCSIIGEYYFRFCEFFQNQLSFFISGVGSTANHKRVTKRLIEFCVREIHVIELCHECFRNANENPAEWFKIVCSQKHPVVWAKVLGYPYEPAKMMKMTDKTTEVFFFGPNHKWAEIESKYCLKYSKEHPNKTSSTSKPYQIKPSVREVLS